jgi:signal transduction histidine kinase
VRPKMGQNNNPDVRVGCGTMRGGTAALTALILTVRPVFAAGPPDLPAETAAFAVAAGAVALAVFAAVWALAQRRDLMRLKRHMRRIWSRTCARVGERDALLGASREALVVWGRDGRGPFSFGGAENLLDSCLKGAEATDLSQALDDLSEQGAAFEKSVHDAQGRRLRVRGRAVGGMAAVWLEPESAGQGSATDFSAILDALPIPVWLRDRTLSLVWGNRAFLAAVGAADLDTVRREQAALERSERDLAAAAQSENRPQQAKRVAIAAGTRRTFAIDETPFDWGVVGAAGDVTDVAASEAMLQRHIEAHTDTLDKLATAVAIFDKDQKLNFYNRAFVRLWNLNESWLGQRPGDGELLDRLRDEGKLPEQRDYKSWRNEHLQLYAIARDQSNEELWHLPSGKTLRVVAQPHPLGGLTFLFEDVTEHMALESSFKTLIKVQTATLNTLREGVAVFGPDGRLKLHNAAFAGIWSLDAKTLEGEPHVNAIAGACAVRFGVEEMWNSLIRNVVSETRAAQNLGGVERNDGLLLSPTLSPLPDGATLVTFADVTDRSRIETMLRERAEVMEDADRLKSDFIKHVSYELRTPLNTILGFAEHLSTEMPGVLNQRQREYVQAIVEGSNTLKNLVNDILDLALVESGAMRLELKRIEMVQFLTEIAAYGRDWAGKAGLTLEVEMPKTPCEFVGDERRLSQVLYNLLSNAFKYTQRGGIITLSGRIEDEDVQFTVRDNGPGIPPEVRATVFERFAAKGSATARGGAGLGLALVNRFVELHDGWVEIEDTGGTQVRCHIPRRLYGEVAAPAGDTATTAAE